MHTRCPIAQDLEASATASLTPIKHCPLSSLYSRSHQPDFLFPSRIHRKLRMGPSWDWGLQCITVLRKRKMFVHLQTVAVILCCEKFASHFAHVYKGWQHPAKHATQCQQSLSHFGQMHCIAIACVKDGVGMSAILKLIVFAKN